MKKQCEIKQKIPQQLQEEMNELSKIGVNCSEIDYLIGMKTGKL